MPGGHQRLTESADEKGAATSPKNRQLPPRRKARKQCGFPRAFTCSHPANGPQPPPLRYARRRLVPCGHAPALAARKKAARPVRPRTGLSCPVTDPDGWAAYRPPGACGCPPCFFSAAPFKAVELRSTPGKLLKKFDQNFFAPPAALFRPCGTQKGGLSRPATDRLVLCGHAPLTCLRRILQTPGLQSPR